MRRGQSEPAPQGRGVADDDDDDDADEVPDLGDAAPPPLLSLFCSDADELQFVSKHDELTNEFVLIDEFLFLIRVVFLRTKNEHEKSLLG